MSEQDHEARERRKKQREQKLRGAAVLEARREMRETLEIAQRMEKKYGRTPRREVDKKFTRSHQILVMSQRLMPS